MSEKCEVCSYIQGFPFMYVFSYEWGMYWGSGTGGTVISKMLAKTSVNQVNEKDPRDRPLTARFVQGFMIQSDFTQVHIHAVKTHNFKMDFYSFI